MRYVDPHALGLEVVRVSGSEAYCLCPFHHDHTPSASFNMESGLFHCFACGEDANTKRLLRELGGEIVFTSRVASPRRKESEDWEWILLASLALGNDYLAGRGISDELVRRFQIREVKDGVAFIIHDLSGKPVGAQVRRYAGKPKYLFYGDRGIAWPVSTIFDSHSDEAIIITEGVFGALRGIAAGRKAAASMGASAISGISKLLNGRRRIAFFDNDLAGHIGAAKLVSTGARAVFPGGEADETSLEQWAKLEQNFYITDNYNEIALGSSDPKRVQNLVSRYLKRLGKVR